MGSKRPTLRVASAWLGPAHPGLDSGGTRNAAVRASAMTRRLSALIFGCYLLGALWVTSALWVNPAGRRQLGDLQDVNQATWYIRYAATAIERFRLPALLTTAMNAPHGVNLMWNTPFLLAGSVLTPVTLAFGPQVSLTLLLVIGFAGSAAAMFYVLRRWNTSLLAAALGGALYGFAPAMINSGIGHYSLVLGMIPPLMIDRMLRIVTGRGSPVRNGLWLGLLAAVQLFVSEELLALTAIAAAVVLLVLALSRPHDVPARIRPTLAGFGTAAGVALVLCAKALWDQFHGVVLHGAGGTVVLYYQGRLTNLGTLPFAFITPSRHVLLGASGLTVTAARYSQPLPDYLAYLGIPLIIVLLAALVYFWRNLAVRVAGVSWLILEWLGMGGKALVPHVVTLPGLLLPWQYLQHLPLFSAMVPDRLTILADAGAAVVLAVSLDLVRDLARRRAGPFGRWRAGATIATGVAVVALLPLVPAPYTTTNTGHPPPGWRATFTALRVAPSDPVLLAPYPYGRTSQVMRWVGISGGPQMMIGGMFISPNSPRQLSRAGKAGLTATGCYIDELYAGQTSALAPTAAQIRADLATMRPAAVVADTTTASPLGQFLIGVFGQPTTRIGQVLGWRLSGSPPLPQGNGHAAEVATGDEREVLSQCGAFLPK
jgi:hypothetical protein